MKNPEKKNAVNDRARVYVCDQTNLPVSRRHETVLPALMAQKPLLDALIPRLGGCA